MTLHLTPREPFSASRRGIRPRWTGLHVSWPQDRSQPYAYLTIDRGLRSGMQDEVRLTEHELVDLLADASARLRDLHDAKED